MKNWTGIEVERARQGLEQASASILGRMIFEFSRFDMALGLMLVWADEGSQVKKLTTMVSGYTSHRKLELLAALARTKYQADREAMDAYDGWLSKAHEVRTNRNELIHGRWGVDHMNNQVVNVIGLPTGEQIERRYTLPELKVRLKRIQQLEKQLATLREKWPV